MIGKAFLALVFSITLLLPCSAYAASLTVSPKAGMYTVGQGVTYSVMVVGEQPLNAIGAKLIFPTEFFTLESVSKSGSVLNFWVVEPSAIKSTGIVQFEGVSLTGFAPGSGTVITVTLRAKKAGSGSISFQSGQILANDGQGTDITGNLNGASFTITPSPQGTMPPAKPSTSSSPIVDVLMAHGVELVQPSRIAPEIRLGETHQEPAIFGFSSHPYAHVLLTFVPRSGMRLFITGTSDAKGNFVLSVPTALRNGPYAVTAVVVLKDGSQSEPSVPLIVEIDDMTTGNFSYVGPIYASLALLFVLVTMMYVILWRRLGPQQDSQASMAHELMEAEDAVHRSFGLLREDIEKHKDRYGSRGSTVGDAHDTVAIEESLDQAELLIEKEIQDVGIAALNKRDSS